VKFNSAIVTAKCYNRSRPMDVIDNSQRPNSGNNALSATKKSKTAKSIVWGKVTGRPKSTHILATDKLIPRLRIMLWSKKYKDRTDKYC